jgi:hypothetical protein
MSVRGRNEVTRRPIVGASQMTATIPRTMWIGVRFSPRSSRALAVSRAGAAIRSVATFVLI